ncbi:MAG TPA: ABC transporter substrate-binding protein [Chloroflexota bacterium]|nr:ABC transporter substrate-binding protein [Chloroflexota bacterium]
MSETIKLISFQRSLGLVAAERKGLFADEGLGIEYTQTPSSATQIRGVLDGTWDVAQTAADNVMAYVENEGADLFVFLVANLGLGQKLFVQPEITAYERLRGKVLVVDALDTGYAYVLQKMLQLNGLGPDSYRFESVGGTPQRLQALRERRAAGALLSGHPEETALREGFSLLQSASDYFPLYPGDTHATTRRWSEGHGELLAGYIRAYLRGCAWAAEPANRDEGISLIADDQQVSTEAAAARYERDRETRSAEAPSLDEVRAALQVVLDLRWEMAAMPGPRPSPSKYFDPSYWERGVGPS